MQRAEAGIKLAFLPQHEAFAEYAEKMNDTADSLMLESFHLKEEAKAWEEVQVQWKLCAWHIGEYLRDKGD